jgi:hypothetical protein
MTNKELSQLYYLKRDIDYDIVRLTKLEENAVSTVTVLSCMSGNGTISDKTSIACDITDLRDIIINKLEQNKKEYQSLYLYINNIKDPYIRLIFKLRHIDLLSWIKVARKIGGGNTPDSVRMAHDRYLSRNR